MDNMNTNPRGGTFCLSKAGLAIGGTKSGVAIAAPNGAGVDFVIGGELLHKADAATVAITAAVVQAVLTICLYLVTLDEDGTLVTVKGEEVLLADHIAGTAVLKWPELPAGACAIGALKVSLASTATFTAGTTLLDASNVTTTYIDLFARPTGPLVYSA